jgi:putative hydrolase of the HAD superfamily
MINKRVHQTCERPLDEFLKSFIATEKLTSEVILKIGRSFYSEYLACVQMNKDLVNLLIKYKSEGKNIGIISNCYMPDQLYREVFEKLGLNTYIDAYFFSYKEGYKKPHEQLFIHAMVHFNVLPESCLMIGDSLKSDIEPALKLGMQVKHVLTSQ